MTWHADINCLIIYVVKNASCKKKIKIHHVATFKIDLIIKINQKYRILKKKKT